jgi:hypothetical protein
MLRVARVLLGDPGKEPWIVFVRWYEGIEEDLRTCRGERISYLGYCPTSSIPQTYDAMAPHRQAPQTSPVGAEGVDPCVSTEAPQPVVVEAVGPPQAEFDAVGSLPAPVVAEAALDSDVPPLPPVRPRLASVRAAVKKVARRLLPHRVRRFRLRRVVRPFSPGTIRRTARALVRLALPVWLRWFVNSVKGWVHRGIEYLRSVKVAIPLFFRGVVSGRPVTLAHWCELFRVRRFWHEQLSMRLYWHYRLQEVADQLDRVRPSLIILPEDNIEYETSALIREGHRRGVPSAVVPYTIGNKLEAAEAYLFYPSHQANALFNRMLCARHPRWRHQYKGRDLVRMPAAVALVLEELGISSPRPWTTHSGGADLIVLESDALLERAVADGLARDRLIVAGSPRLDDLARHCRNRRQRRDALLFSLRLPDRASLVLCAMPPDQNPAVRPGCEFTSYLDLIRFMLQTLARQPDCNVIVNPHPRVPKAVVEEVAALGVPVLTGDVVRLIPLCDVYVASMSATIPMALACAKPVINYDVYRFGYDDFASSDQVDTVNTRAAYERSVARALGDSARAAHPEAWGCLDGQAGRRLLSLFDGLIDGKCRASAAPRRTATCRGPGTAGTAAA